MIAGASIALPLGFEGWVPAIQAATLAVLTFIQEDFPTVSAALLSAAGRLNTGIGFLGCFVGIWTGDALLYLAARSVGRPLLGRAWAKRFINEAAVARSESWFAQQGIQILIASRLIPGTRLPAYLAAGFLRVPFGRFLLVTGLAVGAWTTAIFVLARTIGTQLVTWAEQSRGSAVIFLLMVVSSILALRFGLRFIDARYRRRLMTGLERWMHWEFWPAWLFYAPVVANYVRLAICYRSLTVPTAANPGIFSGGIVGESKIVTLRDLYSTSPAFTAEAHLIANQGRHAGVNLLQQLISDGRISCPFVLKPDIGQRGAGVKLVRNLRQAVEYVENAKGPVICQRYIAGPHEVGIFYYRLPDQSRGRIFAITEKVFPVLAGDGIHTVEELIWIDARARFVAAKYLERLGQRRTEVLPKGETLKLVEAGNHARGCMFRDGMHLWSEQLEHRIDSISQRLSGFYIGRYDIRYADESDLRAGQNFQIIELNGAASEATSIYDARNSIWNAYRTLFRQWELVFRIGAENRRRGSLSTPVASLWRTWHETNVLIATYPVAD